MDSIKDSEQIIFNGSITDNIKIGGYSFKLHTLSPYEKSKVFERIAFLPNGIIPMISKLEILKSSLISVNEGYKIDLDSLQEIVIERLFEYYTELEERASNALSMDNIQQLSEMPGHWVKWRLVQMFGVPVDSEIIKNINPVQMIWYAMMFNKEREEAFDAKLNMTEYLASFINAEAVRQTRESRDNKKIVPDEDFESDLRKMFGRDLSPEAIENASRAGNMIEEADVKPKETKKKGAISIDDIRKYTGLNVDEVKFIPKK